MERASLLRLASGMSHQACRNLDFCPPIVFGIGPLYAESEMKRKDVKEHSTTYKVGGLGMETLRRVSKNFPTELSVKYSTVHVLNHIHIR